MQKFKKYRVVTPDYEVTEYVEGLEPPGGPSYVVCDSIEIEALNKQDAKAFGVRMMLQEKSPVPHERFQWCKDQKVSGENPYTDVYVIVMEI